MGEEYLTSEKDKKYFLRKFLQNPKRLNVSFAEGSEKIYPLLHFPLA